MSERPSNIVVRVTTNPAPFDFDAWCVRYLTLLIEADRKAQQLPEAA